MVSTAYFVIADITGYTAFMTGSELEHAQDILKTLFDTLLNNIKPPLTISNFQGDAILTYAPEGSFMRGQTLLESIENIYCQFARALENMHRNTTCTCQACANIPKLDLKMFVHYGQYMMQDMRGKQELSGPDVIIAHRMMKNDVKEKTGLKAYALFTDKAVKALGLEDFCDEMHDHSETYDHIGEVPMHAYCLRTMWEQEREKIRDVVRPEEAWAAFAFDTPAPPAVVWDYLTEPQHRRDYLQVKDVKVSRLNHGRVGAGTVHHCAHGKDSASDFMITDWHPFEYFTENAPAEMGMILHFSTHLTPIENGTRVTWAFRKVSGSTALGRFITRVGAGYIKKDLGKTFTNCGNTLRQMIESDLAAGKITLVEGA